MSLLLYSLLACWATWPLARSPATTLPLGAEPAATVPLFNAWTIWWNADRLTHGFKGYWDAPIFFPFAESFAWSEPQPMTLLAAPVLWISGSRALAYNGYLWLSLVLNGWFCERLLRRLGVRRLTALAGGAAMLLLPIIHWQRDVLQLIPVWGLLWAWSGLLAIARRPRWRGGVELGLGVGAFCLASLHQGLFLAVLMVLAAPALGLRWLRWRTWTAMLLAVGLAAALVLPIALPMQRMLEGPVFVRTANNVAQLSATWGDYCGAHGGQWVEWGKSAARPHWYLSPGWIKVGLAFIGIAWGLARRRWRWWTVFLCCVSGAALVLSLGPQFHIGEWQPWAWLQAHVPGFAQVRNVFRFAFFVQIGVVLLACQGCHGLDVLRRRCLLARSRRGERTPLSRVKRCDDSNDEAAGEGLGLREQESLSFPAPHPGPLPRSSPAWMRRALRGRGRRRDGAEQDVRHKVFRRGLAIGLALIGIAALTEITPQPVKLAAVPNAALHAKWIRLLQTDAAPDAAVACVPFAPGNGVGDFEMTTRWMYLGTYHQRLLVNGYSGFFPMEDFALRGAMPDGVPTAAVLQQFARDEVEWLVVLRAQTPDGLPPPPESVRLQLVLSDEVGVDVYRLIPVPDGSIARPE